ncbi:hypothetical protein NX722_01470 [Endozoicomonas gorgoniicola]|uniref:Uncharacterized protein n=1 Tax=Endozoicomonas gorgoniicola TaxID=1234144 RepID=A0ABT3MPM4_9GAMM|nr:hypothetical protein [Endozoicomonas gorgoniicola]MCW7551330.1 hypothetical protein [Endozoicomonas gorgoniicola]
MVGNLFIAAPLTLKRWLRQFDKKYISKIVGSGGVCTFLLGIFSEENVMFELDVEVINQLAEYGIRIVFDFYGGED